jgi:hypothetical protein
MNGRYGRGKSTRARPETYCASPGLARVDADLHSCRARAAAAPDGRDQGLPAMRSELARVEVALADF